MGEQPPAPGDYDPVQESVVRWLDEVAEAENITREAAVESLVSSYWQLKEVLELLDEPELPDRRLDSPDSARGDRSVHEGPGSIDRSEDDTIANASPAELRDRLDDVESALETLEAELSTLRASTVSSEAFAAKTDQARSFQDAISSKHDDLRGRHTTLHNRVHAEFENIRTILTRLIESTTANEDRVQELVESVQTPLRSHLTAEETLQAITRTAIEEGVRTADCGRCELRIDLALLESPSCPRCDASFSGIETTERWFGLRSAHRLQTPRPEQSE